jgi:hypothetical protein
MDAVRLATLEARSNRIAEARRAFEKRIVDAWNVPDLLEDFPETIANTVDRHFLSLIDDLVLILFENSPTRFLNASYVSMDGTNHSLVTFEFDAIMFDAKFCATSRTSGLKLSERNSVIATHFSHS